MAIKPPIKYLVLISTMAVSLTACNLTQTSLPAISDSGSKHLGHIVWHDLVTPDLEKSQAFYSAVFDWQFQSINDSYVFAINDGQTIAGFSQLDNSENSSHWLALVSVNNVDSVIKQTRQSGGEVLVGNTTIEGRGNIAVLSDPQGAVFSVIDTSNGDPNATNANNSWIWQEVWSDDPKANREFYQSIYPYEAAEKTLFGTNYSYIKTDNQPVVGFVEKPDAEIGNTWVNYIKVADVDATLLKVTAAGGLVLMAPNEKVRSGTVAIIRDSNGAGLVIQESIK